MSEFHKEPVMTKATFEQDEDTSSTRGGAYVSQEIEVETVFVDPKDKYFVIKTERWWFNTIEDLVALLKKAGCT